MEGLVEHQDDTDDENDDIVSNGIRTLSLSEEEDDQEPNIFHYGPLSSKFYAVECPFIWETFENNLNIDGMLMIIGRKLYPVKKWKVFCLKLYFAYLYSLKGSIDEAFQNIEFCEKYLNDHANDDFHKDMLQGLKQVVLGTKAHLHFRIGDVDIADNIISQVVPYEELSNTDKAGVIAMEAHLSFHFGPEGKEDAVDLAKMAIDLDPDEMGLRRGAWYHLAGKAMAQIRRIENRFEMPSKEELKLLERAVKYNPFPVSLAVLADSYRDYAVHLCFNDNSQGISERIIHRLWNESRRLYCKAIEMNDSHPGTLRRCGHGLMKLPYKYRDLNLSKMCLEKVLSLEPANNSALFSMGMLLDRYLHKPEEALNYYQQAFDGGNNVAGIFMIQVRFKMDSSYNPLEHCNRYIRHAMKHSCTAECVLSYNLIKGEYCLFIQTDLISGAKYWERAIKLAPWSQHLTHHKALFAGRKSVINVYDCLQDKIGKALETNSYDEETSLFLRNVLDLCKESASQ